MAKEIITKIKLQIPRPESRREIAAGKLATEDG
jgi:hypothetical protein